MWSQSGGKSSFLYSTSSEHEAFSFSLSCLAYKRTNITYYYFTYILLLLSVAVISRFLRGNVSLCGEKKQRKKRTQWRSRYLEAHLCQIGRAGGSSSPPALPSNADNVGTFWSYFCRCKPYMLFSKDFQRWDYGVFISPFLPSFLLCVKGLKMTKLSCLW